MGMTVLKSEDFASHDAFGSTFTTRAGQSFAGRRVGPGWISPGDPGWSAIVRNVAGTGEWDLTVAPANGANPRGAIGAWFNFVVPPAGGGYGRFLYMNRASADQVIQSIGINSAGVIQTENGGWSTETPITINYLEWHFFMLAWAYTAAGNLYDYRFYHKIPGGALTQIQSYSALGGNSAPGEAGGGSSSVSGDLWGGRMGGVRLWSFAQSNFSDVVYDAALLEPVVERHTWFIGNNGLAPQTGLTKGNEIPLDASRLNDELKYGGFIPVRTGYANGDILLIDTSGGDFDTHIDSSPAVSLAVGIRGLNLLPYPGQTYWKVRSYRAALAGNWTQDVTNTNLWYTFGTGSESMDGVMVWENDVNPSKIARSAYGSEALALADMNTKPAGEFWCYPSVAGDRVYIKPSGNGNPGTNGKTYSQSSNIGGIGAPTVVVTVLDVNIEGLHVIKTCLAKSSATAAVDGDPVDGTCLNFDVGSGGTYRLANPFFDKWGKHGYKTTNSSSNSPLTEVDVPLGNGSNYCPSGGQTGVAYYNGNAAATGNTVTSTNLSQPTNAMLPQSTGGTINQAYASVIVHNGGAGSQFTTLTFNNANLCSGIAKQIGGAMAINASRTGAISNGSGTATVGAQSRVSGGLSGVGITLQPGCALVLAESLNAANTNIQISGVLSIIGCTIDASACTVGDATASIFYRIGAATITLGANAWRFGGKDIAVVANAATGEITANDNWYEKPVGNRLYENYNASDRTGTQWQGLGFDANGGFSADLKVNPGTFLPFSASPLRGAASIARWPTLGASKDLYGLARAAAGNTEAGGVLYRDLNRGMYFERLEGM